MFAYWSLSRDRSHSLVPFVLPSGRSVVNAPPVCTTTYESLNWRHVRYTLAIPCLLLFPSASPGYEERRTASALLLPTHWPSEALHCCVKFRRVDQVRTKCSSSTGLIPQQLPDVLRPRSTPSSSPLASTIYSSIYCESCCAVLFAYKVPSDPAFFTYLPFTLHLCCTFVVWYRGC